MIHIVGIDFHKDQHRARCLDDRAQSCDSFSFKTTPEGLTKLEERIFQDGANPIIVFEPAGLAWLVVAVYPRSRHPDCRLVKAKMQKIAALRRYLRGSAKSDRIDALNLAKMPFIEILLLDFWCAKITLLPHLPSHFCYYASHLSVLVSTHPFPAFWLAYLKDYYIVKITI